MEARCKTPMTLRSTATLTFLAFFVGSVATLVLVSYLPHSGECSYSALRSPVLVPRFYY